MQHKEGRLSITSRGEWLNTCSQTVKETVEDFVPVDCESLTHKMLVLLMFRSVMVHM